MTLRRTSTLKPSPRPRRRPARNTGPTPAQRAMVAERAAYRCELCGILLHDGTTWSTEHSFHHRLPRGMGGTSSKDANNPPRLLLVCGTGTTGCHGFIESHRTSAEQEGWLVRHGLDPADVPVTVYAGPYASAHTFTRRVLLTPAGDYQEVAA